jgi:hypothetical protein
MQGPWTDFDKLGDCGKIYINFRVSFLKICGPCVNFCKAQISGRCMDHELIIIKLAERCLDPGRCRQIA